jgi:hypothetical protein
MNQNYEVRTICNILADLLQIAIDGEWSGQTNTHCHCHPEYASSCPDCGTLQYPHNDSRREHPNEHKSDCKRQALIRESRAFLEVENSLAEARGDDTVYVP